MSDQQLIDLYSGRILELATQIPHTGRLDGAAYSARKRAPLCGSTITVDFDLTDGRVSRFGQDVKACALGQAAASVVGQNIMGRDFGQVQAARDQLAAMLARDGPAPDAPFDDLKVLLPARSFTNRHASILLALDALLEGWPSTEKTKPV